MRGSRQDGETGSSDFFLWEGGLSGGDSLLLVEEYKD